MCEFSGCLTGLYAEDRPTWGFSFVMSQWHLWHVRQAPLRSFGRGWGSLLDRAGSGYGLFPGALHVPVDGHLRVMSEVSHPGWALEELGYRTLAAGRTLLCGRDLYRYKVRFMDHTLHLRSWLYPWKGLLYLFIETWWHLLLLIVFYSYSHNFFEFL